MASHLTGSREILYIRMKQLCVTIKGNPCYPGAEVLGTVQEASSVAVESSEVLEEVRLLGESRDRNLNSFPVQPLFYEQQSYEMVVEGLGPGRLGLEHASRSIRESVTPVGSHRNLLTGIVNFGNDIGYSDFVLTVDGQKVLKLRLEVFPGKIDYRRDYQAIVADETEEVYGLVFDFLKTTYHSFGLSNRRNPSRVEFFSILIKIFDRFLQALDQIIRQPQHLLQGTHRILPGYRVKRTDRTTVRWVEHHPDRVCFYQGKLLAERVSALEKQVTVDTRENQLTVFLVQTVIRKLQDFEQKYLQLQRKTDPEMIQKLENMLGSLRQRMKNSFLDRLEGQPRTIGLSLVFMMAPGYRELYRCSLMLEKGLDVTGDLFHLSVKDLAQLYEYWCFIKLNSLLRNRYQLLTQDIIRTEGNRLFVTMVKGQGSRVRYRNPENGEQIVLTYNPRVANLPTVSQKPDNVLSLKKNSGVDGRQEYQYVFDATYKIDPALEGTYYYSNISHIPGPREEDINTMHRYRDAIVCRVRNSRFRERPMFGAYVLFPYGNEDQYQNHRFYQSIEKVNIGGLPFLPSATGLVENMLDTLVEESPRSAMERALLPAGLEKQLARVNWSKRDVLVGELRNKKQLDICRQHRFYHVPAGKLADQDLPIHYVALYQSRKLFGKDSGIFLYGEVVRTALVKRKNIREIPGYSEELYYRFAIQEWKLLPRPIGVREKADVVLLTNLFLLQNSREVPDLRIRSEEEYRLYYELRRMTGEQLQDGDKPLSYRYRNLLLDCRKGQLRVMKNGKIVRLLAIEDFNRHPGKWFREILKG